MPTRADSLRHALAFALRSVRTAQHRLGLSEGTRYDIADQVVRDLTREGRWPELKEESAIPVTPANGPHDKRPSFRPDPPTDDPVALVEWGKRNIQS
jgi:hypothetical protein